MVAAAAIGARLITPSLDRVHLGPAVHVLAAPAIGTSTMCGTAGRDYVRDNVVTASRGPRGPIDDVEVGVVAVEAVIGEVDDGAHGRPRNASVKKPSAPPAAEALLQQPPSRSTSPASCSTMESSGERTITSVVMTLASLRAGTHTPAAGGRDTAGNTKHPGGKVRGATLCDSPCNLVRSN